MAGSLGTSTTLSRRNISFAAWSGEVHLEKAHERGGQRAMQSSNEVLSKFIMAGAQVEAILEGSVIGSRPEISLRSRLIRAGLPLISFASPRGGQGEERTGKASVDVVVRKAVHRQAPQEGFTSGACAEACSRVSRGCWRSAGPVPNLSLRVSLNVSALNTRE